MSTPALDPRWPSPGLAIVFYTLILFPSVAILAIYAPIVSTPGFRSQYKSTGHGSTFVYAAVTFSSFSVIHVIISFGCLMYACLSPIGVLIVGTVSTILWGGAIGGSIVFWRRNSSKICSGDWGEPWDCGYEWPTLLCCSVATGASLLIVFLSSWTLRQLLRNPKPENRLKAFVVRVGPPSTPPVNLATSRAHIEFDRDSLLEDGSGTNTPIRLYAPQRSEFEAAGGAGKLILPHQLDPTSSGFVPGRLFYGPSLPEPRATEATNKGKGTPNRASHAVGEQSMELVRTSLVGDQPPQNSELSLSAQNNDSLGPNALIPPTPVVPLPKPLPALPVRMVDTVIAPRRPVTYYYPRPPQQVYLTERHHSDIWTSSAEVGPSNYQRTENLPLPPAIPDRHPLRRISSAPTGSFHPTSPPEEGFYLYGNSFQAQPSDAVLIPPRPILEFKPNMGYDNIPAPESRYRPLTASPQNENALPRVIPVSFTPPTRTVTGGSTPNRNSTYTPRRPSNLTLSYTPDDISPLDQGEGQGAQLSTSSGENSWEHGGEELLHRTVAPSVSLDGALVPPSNVIPFHPDSTETAGSIAPTPGTNKSKHRSPRSEDTYSSDESDGSLGIDPEKLELVAEEAAEKRRAAETSSPTVQEMTEVPQSLSLTLPTRNTPHVHLRTVSSPMPVPIPSAHPVLQLSSSPETPSINSTRSRDSDMNTNRIVSDASPAGRQSVDRSTEPNGMSNPNRNRYPTVAPLAMTRDLTSIRPLTKQVPRLQINPIPYNAAVPSSATLMPTPKTPRSPIPDLRAQCVGHFTVSPTGDVEVSTHDPDSPPYRGRIESISSVCTTSGRPELETRGANHTIRPSRSEYSLPTVRPTEIPSPSRALGSVDTDQHGRGTHTTPAAVQEFWREMHESPTTRDSRRRSRSGPAVGSSVRFELSRNEVYPGGTWTSSSEEETLQSRYGIR